ncbi:biotin transporter BioY [Anaeromyxobacter diazotrophicus]|uniref:Biotin transporter n=1 Tax=Anaeromyxobacter diazotrophicus TaxID=2590199 RepID=A0A7I9VRS9_9BACT|nr:biotin transporter BioY [Anaeromyxobacter diazotrophicus]GEJ59133.1 biotin biosynthesis protein BioY [Anaeromyxobacter diazotrophicus]
MNLVRTHRLVWIALLAACIAAGAWIQLPLGPVPFTLQPLFAFLAGFLLGPLGGPAAVLLYLAAGVLGLPVFAGGASGLGVLFGPTGGYLAGFVLAAAVTGLAHGRAALTWARGLAFGAAALAVAYAAGVLQLRAALALGWRAALVAGVAPFVLQDLAKVALAVATARFLGSHRLAPP